MHLTIPNLTDLYQGELEHRRAKKFYPRTSRKGHTQQIAQHTRREKVLQSISAREAARRLRIATNPSSSPPFPSNGPNPTATRRRGRPRKSNALGISFKDSGPLPPTPFRVHHQISESQVNSFDLTQFVLERKNDPALKVSSSKTIIPSWLSILYIQGFIPLLKGHLISRLTGKEYEGDEDEYGPSERLALQFRANRIYFTKTMRVNYTTYDMRRDQDSLNP